MSPIIADRYARAFFELSVDRGVSDQVHDDMAGLLDLCVQSPEFARLLSDPVIPVAQKQQAIEASLADKVHDSTLTFLKFLAEKKRLALLPGLTRAYQDLYLEARNQVPAEIESKVALTKAQVTRITERIQTLIKKEILPELRVDAAMLGGFRIRIRNQIFDHTIESKLRKFKRAVTHH